MTTKIRHNDYVERNNLNTLEIVTHRPPFSLVPYRPK